MYNNYKICENSFGNSNYGGLHKSAKNAYVTVVKLDINIIVILNIRSVTLVTTY